MTKTCDCGRPVSAGWTATTTAPRCCICETARVMATFRYVPKRPAPKKAVRRG